jgi:Ca2+/H+ antiporter, TMEM165/GDT1 family
MHAFWLALVMVFLAELGDKTQLVALCMAARYRAGVVLAGVFVATLTVHLVSVGLGSLAGKFLPEIWVGFIAGVAFIAFGMWTLRGDSLDDDECPTGKGRSPFWIVTITFFLAELGDKTMLTTVALAAKGSVLLVWLGSSLGMVVSDGLAIVVGQMLGAKLPERVVKVVAACIFFAFGIFSMVSSGRGLPIIAWAGGVAALLILAFIFFRGSGMDRAAQPKPAAD